MAALPPPHSLLISSHSYSTGIFDKRNSTPFVVLDVVPENVSHSAFPHISEPHDDDRSQGPQGDNGDSNPPTETEHIQPALVHAMSTTALRPASLYEEITNSPQESTQAGTETPELVTHVPHTRYVPWHRITFQLD